MDPKKKKNKFGPRRRKLAGKNSLERSLDKCIFSRSLKARNGSFLQNATLKDNNRALARALADMRSHFGLAHQQNLTYQFEQQAHIQRINELEHLVSLQPKDVEKKLSESYKKKFFYIKNGLNEVCEKLMDAVNILPTLIDVCNEVTSGETAEIAEESTFNHSSYNSTSLSSQQVDGLKGTTNVSYGVKSCNIGPLTDIPKTHTEPVEKTAFDMSVIMEQSGLEETLQMISDNLEVGGSIPTKHKRSSVRRWSQLFKFSPLANEDECSDCGKIVDCESSFPETSPELKLQEPGDEPIAEEMPTNQILKVSVLSPSKVLSTNHTSHTPMLSADVVAKRRKLRRTTFIVTESKQILPFPFDLDNFYNDENVPPNSEELRIVSSVDPPLEDISVCEKESSEKITNKIKNSKVVNQKRGKKINSDELESGENDPGKVLSLPAALKKENKARKKEVKCDLSEVSKNELLKHASLETEQFPIVTCTDSSVKGVCENSGKKSPKKKSPKKRKTKNLDATHPKRRNGDALKSSGNDPDIYFPLSAAPNKEKKSRKKKVNNDIPEISKKEFPKNASPKSEQIPVISAVALPSEDICDDTTVCENSEKESRPKNQKKTKNSDGNHKKRRKTTVEVLKPCENDPDKVLILPAAPTKGNKARKKKIKEDCI